MTRIVTIIALFLAVGLAVGLATGSAEAALTRVTTFGDNPGALAMYEYVPANLPAKAPLVLVLHGCSQNAAEMEKAGWNQLADLHGFAVVYPEQASANNPAGCFNWAGDYGDTADLVRGQGENQSILSMVDKAIAAHDLDPARVFITGFSAGAAFTAVMLATWPDRFAGGAILSGLPYRCATSLAGAFSCQSPGVTKTAAQWGDLVRAAHAYTGARPRVQIWHGSTDGTVVPANQTELIKQWTNAHGADADADETETIGMTTRTAYKAGAQVVVEAYRVTGMGHAIPVGTDPMGTCTGTAGTYFVAGSLCSTLRAARFFGLIGGGGGGGGGDDTEPPIVAIVSPADGDEVTGPVTIVVAATDDVAMSAVSLAIDGVEVGAPDDSPPYQFEWNASAPGDHTLVATARDAAGNTSTASATVTVTGAGGGGSGRGGGGGGCNASGGGTSVAAFLLVLLVTLLPARPRVRRRRGRQPRRG